MKGGQNLRELQSNKQKQVEEQWIHPPVCMVCKKACEGYYGRHGDTGTCNSACEKVQVAKPKYPGHSEEDYFNRLGDQYDSVISCQAA